MITLIHYAWRGGKTPHLLLYNIQTNALVLELPISKERAEIVLANGGTVHADSPKQIQR